MCKVYGASYKKIASELGISVSGVEKHVARGLKICNAYVDRMEQSTTEHGDHQGIAVSSSNRQLGNTPHVVGQINHGVIQRSDS